MPITARVAVLALALYGLAVPKSARAQLCHGADPPGGALASAYLPLGHPTYRYLDLLIARGRLSGLDPMAQPYRRIEVAGAVHEALGDPDLSEPEREWLSLVARELGRESAAPRDTGTSRVAAEARAGSWAVTHEHRDLLRPTGAESLFPFVEVGLAAEFPHVAAVLHARSDEWFLNDPQFPDGEVVEHHGGPDDFDYAIRVQEGYLEVQFPHMRLLAGRLYRNWGPPDSDGLLISDYPYSYDQLGYWLGVGCLNIQGFIAQLDEFPNNVKRWLSAHRLHWRPRANLALTVTEGVVYGGEGRSLDFRLANPISVWLVAGYGRDFEEGSNSNNNFTELSAWWRPFRGTVTYLSLLIDDFPGGGTPLMHAGSLGLRFPRIAPRLGLRLEYTQVAALTYRSALDHQVYSVRNLGLGRDIADNDLLSVQVDWAPHASLLLSPVVQLLRRGEGDLRDPWPADGSEDGPILFIGEVETTLRLAARGQWLPSRAVSIEWDVGPNLVWDAGHVERANRAFFVGRLQVSLGWKAWGRVQ